MNSEYRVNDASDTNETAIIQYASIARFNFSANLLLLFFFSCAMHGIFNTFCL